MKTAFALAYPKKAAKIAHARYDMKHSYAPRATALGVALVALPIGYVLGRLTSVRGRQRPSAAVNDRHILSETSDFDGL